MWSETLGYRQCRLPFTPAFLAALAAAVPFSPRDDVLDLGSGPGEIAVQIAPLARSVTALDAEQPMLDELARRAKAAGRDIRRVLARAEGAPLDLGPFKLITIANAHQFMHHPGTFDRLNRWLASGGRIAICRARDGVTQAWPALLRDVRRKWGNDHRGRTRMTAGEFFADAPFDADKKVRVPGRQKIDLDHLLLRAQAYSTSAPAVLGQEKTRAMLEELRTLLLPYFRNGPLVEDFTNEAELYRRRGDP